MPLLQKIQFLEFKKFISEFMVQLAAGSWSPSSVEWIRMFNKKKKKCTYATNTVVLMELKVLYQFTPIA